jgi:hypothetical protein
MTTRVDPRAFLELIQSKGGYDPAGALPVDSQIAKQRIMDVRERQDDRMGFYDTPVAGGEFAPIVGLLRGISKRNQEKLNDEELRGVYDEYRGVEEQRAQREAQADAAKAEAKRKADLEAAQNKAMIEQMAPYRAAQKMGFEGSYSDFMQSKKSGGVTVNTGNTGPQFGTIPQGFMLNSDGGSYRMEAVPGGPAAIEAAELEDKAAGRQAATARAGGTVIQDLERGAALIPSLSQGDGVSGASARLVKSKVPGTPEYNFTLFKESALSNVGLDTLQQMRENSPTGGALGQVPIQQQQRLEQVLGSLDVTQPTDVLEANVRRIQNIYNDIIYGDANERARAVEKGRMTPEQSQEIDSYYFELPFDDRGRVGDPPQGSDWNDDLEAELQQLEQELGQGGGRVR